MSGFLQSALCLSRFGRKAVLSCFPVFLSFSAPAEATDRLGGQINLAAGLERRREIVGIADWLAREVELAGVEVRLNSYAETGDVLALEPDVVFVAVGRTPNLDFSGSDETLVTSG